MDWTKPMIQKLLRENDAAVIRGVIVLQGLQTNAESDGGYTRESNKRGWSQWDAAWMKQAFDHIRRGELNPAQLAITRNRLLKYAGQLAAVANEKQQAAESPYREAAAA